MNNKGWPSLKACWPLAVGFIVMLCLRVAWVAVNPWLNYLAEALLVMMLALAMRSGLMTMALLFAVLGPLAAWLLDVVDGPMALVYGAATLVMAKTYVRARAWHPALRAAAGALAASAAVALGTALTLVLSREMTPLTALGYAFARQVWHTAAYFAGGLVCFAKW